MELTDLPSSPPSWSGAGTPRQCNCLHLDGSPLSMRTGPRVTWHTLSCNPFLIQITPAAVFLESGTSPAGPNPVGTKCGISHIAPPFGVESPAVIDSWGVPTRGQSESSVPTPDFHSAAGNRNPPAATGRDTGCPAAPVSCLLAHDESREGPGTLKCLHCGIGLLRART